MKYVSLGNSDANSAVTASSTPSVCITDAIVNGIAPDGGLYVPNRWPVMDHERLSSDMSFADFSKTLLRPFFEEDPLASHLDEICDQAFNFPFPSVDLGDGRELLELFHGPTCAFKDFGARFLALCMNHIPSAPRSPPRVVLVATSGDTGGAVASAFHSLTSVPVVILYPKSGVTLRQEKQLTTWGPQVKAFAVEGSFDDCQRIVKQALASRQWQERHQIISANSINLARLFPQMAYFAYASLRYEARHRKPVTLVIPSGNMGNASAALWGLHLGFPIAKVIFAHNANRPVPDFYNTRRWAPQPTVSTLANAMDVGNPSNFQRIHRLYDESVLRSLTDAVSVSDEEIVGAIRETFRRWRLIICPHTAAGLFVGRKLSAAGNSDWLVAATAHASKFEKVLAPILDSDLKSSGFDLKIEVPPQLAELLERPMLREELAPTLEDLTRAWLGAQN